MLGKTIDLNCQRRTIVGVMAKDFDFPAPTDVWLLLAMDASERVDRKNVTLALVGLLRPGISLCQAQAQIASIGARLAAAYPQPNKGVTIRAIPIVESVEGNITRDYSFLLLVAVGIVLLIACSNIANLQLARSMTPQQELALRLALGASRAARHTAAARASASTSLNERRDIIRPPLQEALNTAAHLPARLLRWSGEVGLLSVRRVFTRTVLTLPRARHQRRMRVRAHR